MEKCGLHFVRYGEFEKLDGSCKARSMEYEGVIDSYKYFSKNTLDHFSLHDCVCSRMYFNGSSIILDMEWMEVLSSHPNNPFIKAHQSKEGRLVLENPSLDKCTLIPFDEKEKQSRKLALNEIDVRNIEVLSFDVEADGDGYKLTLYGELDNCQGNAGYAFIDMIIRFSSSQDMFNELAGESWFE